MSLVDGGLQWVEQRVEREMNEAETPDRALEVATAATTVAPEVQRNEHISTMSHHAYEQVVEERLVSAFGDAVAHAGNGRGHDFVVTRGGKKVGVEVFFGRPGKPSDPSRMVDKVLRAFATTPDLDALVYVSTALPPADHRMAEPVDLAQQQGKALKYVRWTDDGDTPTLRQVIEELL